MTPQVSIIVPCYNAAPYLPKCLKSILRQTFTDIEVITVNDGSTDDTLAVLERYAAKDQRIRIINAPHNCGLQWARHRGIKTAQGQWIMFVDADDFITEDYVMRMHSGITQTGADAAMSSMNYNVHKRLPFLHMPKHTRFAHFAGKTPYVHLDIAGVAYFSDPQPYYAVGASGYGVRLLYAFVQMYDALQSK